MTPASKLRIGLLLDSLEVRRWAARMITSLLECDFVEVRLVILNDAGVPREEPAEPWDSLAQTPPPLMAKFLMRVRERIVDHPPRIPDALERVDCSEELRNIRTLRVTPERRQYSSYFRDDDVEAIEREQLDVLIRCGFGILRGGILKAARFGVWSFHHGDTSVHRGGPPGFWEWIENWPLTGSVLQILSEDVDNGIVLYKSISRSDPFSLRDGRSANYWKSATFVVRVLRQLHSEGEEAFFRRVHAQNGHPRLYSERFFRYPSNRELARLTYRKLVQKVRHSLRHLFHFDQWILLFDIRPEFSSSLWRYKKIVPPKDRFWADPHVVWKDDAYYIFVEEYLYHQQKGRIAVLRMQEDGSHESPRVVLEKPYHLSYPFIFEFEDQFYMIPETLQNGTIELYRCTQFPDRWEHVMDLMTDVRAVDTTVIRENGKWWLFTNLVSVPGASTDDELFLFYSDELLSRRWTPHPGNPIVTDCRQSRPAGRLFRMNGRLYRPSQNCGTRYGYGFNISEVTVLDEERYVEEVVSSVEPKWDRSIRGTHTFSHAHHLHVIDALQRRRR